MRARSLARPQREQPQHGRRPGDEPGRAAEGTVPAADDEDLGRAREDGAQPLAQLGAGRGRVGLVHRHAASAERGHHPVQGPAAATGPLVDDERDPTGGRAGGGTGVGSHARQCRRATCDRAGRPPSPPAQTGGVDCSATTSTTSSTSRTTEAATGSRSRATSSSSPNLIEGPARPGPDDQRQHPGAEVGEQGDEVGSAHPRPPVSSASGRGGRAPPQPPIAPPPSGSPHPRRGVRTRTTEVPARRPGPARGAAAAGRVRTTDRSGDGASDLHEPTLPT